MFDEARVIDGMIKMCNMTQSEVAKKLGVSQSYVGNKVRLLGFSKRAEEMIVIGGLSERHARALLRIKDEDKLLEAINKTVDRRLTVAECEALVDINVEATAPKILGRAPKNERIDHFMRFISSSLESLNSLGIVTHKEIGKYGRHRYITISIEEV